MHSSLGKGEHMTGCQVRSGLDLSASGRGGGRARGWALDARRPQQGRAHDWASGAQYARPECIREERREGTREGGREVAWPGTMARVRSSLDLTESRSEGGTMTGGHRTWR